jgi:hypothetical protein
VPLLEQPLDLAAAVLAGDVGRSRCEVLIAAEVVQSLAAQRDCCVVLRVVPAHPSHHISQPANMFIRMPPA